MRAAELQPNASTFTDDTEAEIRTVPLVLAQEGSCNRQAPQPGHLQDARASQAAQARDAILQAAFLNVCSEQMSIEGATRPDFAFWCGNQHGTDCKKMVG